MGWTGVITDVGASLLATYASGSTMINVNKMTVGSGTVSEENMHEATDLTYYRDDGSILGKKSVENGVDFELQIHPRDDGSYTAKEIGLWANVEEGGPVLLALFQNSTGIAVPATATNPDYAYIISAVLLIDNFDNLTVTVDSTAYVPYSVFNPYCDSVEEALDGKVDKETGKGLSQANFTNEEKLKLAGIEAEANKYVLPTASASTLGGVKVGNGLGISSGVLSNSGVRAVATGSANGTVSVNTNGTAADVAVKGLGTAAYKADTAFAAASHNHAASNITSGTLEIARGGTGVTANPSMLTNLASTSAANVFAASPRPGVTGTLPIANGGTGVTANPSMLTNLGSTTATNVFQASPRPGVTGTLGAANGGTGNTSLKAAGSAIVNALDAATSVSQADDYIVAQYAGGGTTTTTYHRRALKNIRVGGLTTARKLKVALGSTTDVTFDGTADQTSIPVSGTLAVARGGTGATDAATARTNLGAAASSHNHSAANITTGTLAVARGGTGLTASPSMLTNLGSTSAANVLAASPRPGVTGTLPVANGGTGATTAANARTNLGAAAASHTHSPADITGLPKTIGSFTGDGGYAKTINLGYKPSRVILFCCRTGMGLAIPSGGGNTAMYGRFGSVMSMSPGKNLVSEYSSSYETTTDYTTFYNNVLANGYGGGIITSTGFVVGHGAVGAHKESTLTINASNWYYMYFAWA